MNDEIPGPICVCEDPHWRIQLLVDGELVDEVLVNIYANQNVEEISLLHRAETDAAEAEGKVWEISLLCPTCSCGVKFDAQGVRVIS